MDGPELEDYNGFEVLADGVIFAEKDVFYPEVTIVGADYTGPGETITRYSKAYTTAGTIATPHGNKAPGDCAALVRYSTAGRSSRNHPIYLFNYYHCPHVSTTDPDYLHSTWQSILDTYAAQWILGFADGALENQARCGPSGDPAIASVVEDLVTHRDLPRRS